MSLGIIAQVTFWVALLIGARDMGALRTAVFVVLWGVGYVGSGWITGGGFLFDSWVAVLDIVLVMLVFGPDVRVR